jgi:uncharacterized membrane-anchored protein
MSRRLRIVFLAVVAAQLIFPLAVIAYNEFKLASGEEVRLHVQPVDPIDFFRGEYVALSYDISGIKTGGAPPGTTVYVPLYETDSHWTSQSAVLRRPPDDVTFIRGQVTEGGIRFGIETYFVEQGESRRYEEAVQSGDLFVDVVLDDEGDAKIKRLRVIAQG